MAYVRILAPLGFWLLCFTAGLASLKQGFRGWSHAQPTVRRKAKWRMTWGVTIMLVSFVMACELINMAIIE